MTLKYISVEKIKTKRNYLLEKKIGHFVCNNCNLEFIRQPKPQTILKELHFCCKKCADESSKTGKPLNIKKVKNNLIKYGFEHHFKNPELNKKKLATCLIKFGGLAPMCEKSIKEKSKKTILERYQDHFSRIKEIKQKKKNTCLKKYGKEYYSQTESFKSKVNWKESSRKSFETLKKNKINKISKIENQFLLFLKDHFEKIETQKPVNNWLIDFYLPDIETYVQFNGDYWHGINKSYEELINSKNKRDQNIAKTKLRDECKLLYFKDNDLNLVVIKESCFKNKNYEEIISSIKSGYNGL